MILLFTFRNVNNKIKATTTENLLSQLGYVLGIRTDILSEFMVFIESCPFLPLAHATPIWDEIGKIFLNSYTTTLDLALFFHL